MLCTKKYLHIILVWWNNISIYSLIFQGLEDMNFRYLIEMIAIIASFSSFPIVVWVCHTALSREKRCVMLGIAWRAK